MAKQPKVRIIWKGDEVTKLVNKALIGAITEFNLRVETDSKKQLTKGHGVVTGTLRRSIHAASPNYNYAGDNVKPARGTPNRTKTGGSAKNVTPVRVAGLVGSGMNYAIFVHDGQRSFSGYQYITRPFNTLRPHFPAIMQDNAVKVGLLP